MSSHFCSFYGLFIFDMYKFFFLSDLALATSKFFLSSPSIDFSLLPATVSRV